TSTSSGPRIFRAPTRGTARRSATRIAAMRAARDSGRTNFPPPRRLGHALPVVSVQLRAYDPSGGLPPQDRARDGRPNTRPRSERGGKAREPDGGPPVAARPATELKTGCEPT